ncbi:CheY-like superfamily [Pelagophyceae sp. CCMP2097]|nr:CheY-like superfamily [Pelagophyceae sp. CCMP2097]
MFGCAKLRSTAAATEAAARDCGEHVDLLLLDCAAAQSACASALVDCAATRGVCADDLDTDRLRMARNRTATPPLSDSEAAPPEAVPETATPEETTPEAPLAVAPYAEVAATAVEAPQVGLLLIDDQASARKLCGMVFRKAGISHRLAPGGLEALALLDEFDFQLILVDKEMPGVDGVETARRIRARGIQAPMAALTATADAVAVAAFAAAGCENVVAKPHARSVKGRNPGRAATFAAELGGPAPDALPLG